MGGGDLGADAGFALWHYRVGEADQIDPCRAEQWSQDFQARGGGVLLKGGDGLVVVAAEFFAGGVGWLPQRSQMT